MAIPDYQALMLPVLKKAAEGETSVPEAAEKIADDLQLPQKEREELLPSGKQRLLHNRIHWAKFHMSKAGLIDVPKRGRFKASAEGMAVLAKDPSKINVEFLKIYPSFVDFISGAAQTQKGNQTATASTQESSSTPEEQIETAYAVVNAALQAELLDRIHLNSASFFERLIVELLVAMGYGGASARDLNIGKGDGGIDGIIDQDRLGLDRIYVQAKRWASHVTVHRPDIQAFVGSLVGVGATKGVFVTTSSFSAGALSYVKHLPQRVILIDGQRLAELMIEHGVGTRVSRSLELKRLDEDFFSEE